MAEYIEKDAILSKCEEIWNNADETTQTGVDTINTIDEITDFIESLPSADVQPVKHGRWIDCTFYDPYEKSWEQNYEFKCGNCGHKIYNKPNDDNLFCGHCGARMIKDGDTNG